MSLHGCCTCWRHHAISGTRRLIWGLDKGLWQVIKGIIFQPFRHQTCTWVMDCINQPMLITRRCLSFMQLCRSHTFMKWKSMKFRWNGKRSVLDCGNCWQATNAVTLSWQGRHRSSERSSYCTYMYMLISLLSYFYIGSKEVGSTHCVWMTVTPLHSSGEGEE